MHEIGVVRSMVKTVTDFAQANNIAEVTEIVLDIGELSLVIPKYVEDIYPVVVEDTFLKDTKLIINIIPGMAECDECNELFNVIEHEGYCPNCGSFEKTILSGKDFLIREIWGPKAKADNQILRVNMANIRRKIEKNPAAPEYIFTEIGVGYRMLENDA